MKHPEVIAITGASAGVGRATVRRFARPGVSIGLIARGEAGLEGARSDVEQAGGRALAVPTDVADPEAVERAAAAIERAFGPVDVWINAGMTTVFSRFTEMTNEEFRRVTEVDYLGYVYGTRAALRFMLPRNRGHIVQVGSALAYRGIPLQSAYCGAKHAIQGFTEAVRTELMHDGSRVWLTMVQMPALNTPQFDWCKNNMGHRSQPVPPIYQPEVAAEAIYYAATHRRREIYVGASTAVVIIGNKMLPGVGDWYLAKTGFASQQFDGPPAHPDRYNLWQPQDQERDAGAHGNFGARATGRSVQLWLSMHRTGLAALGLAALTTAAAAFMTRRR